MFNHILLEAFCTKDHEENQHKNRPNFCLEENNIPQYNCLLNNCPFFDFTSHEDALCYINANAEVEDIVSLGGEMLPESVDKEKAQLLWKQIAARKIEEAYRVYMDKIKE